MSQNKKNNIILIKNYIGDSGYRSEPSTIYAHLLWYMCLFDNILHVFITIAKAQIVVTACFYPLFLVYLRPR